MNITCQHKPTKKITCQHKPTIKITCQHKLTIKITCQHKSTINITRQHTNYIRSRGNFGEEQFEVAHFQKKVKVHFDVLIEKDIWKVIDASQTVDKIENEIFKAIAVDCKSYPLKKCGRANVFNLIICRNVVILPVVKWKRDMSKVL